MRSIFKQSSFLVMAQGISRVIGFFYTIFLARNLEVSEFGIIATALAYFSIFSVFADFGFNRYLIKEISQDHVKAPKLLFTVTLIRLSLTTVLFAVFSVFLYLFDPDSMRRCVILLAILAVVPQAISFSIDSIFVALRKLQLSSISFVILSISTSLIGGYLVSLGYGPIGVIVATIIGQSIYLLSLIFFLRKLKIGITFNEELTGAKKILKGSLPFGILGVLGLLYFRVDIILLSYLKGNFDAGIYGAAYKFLEAIVFIPSAAGTALFPVTASLILSDRQKVLDLYKKTSKILFLLGLVISLCFIFILPIIISVFLPQYHDSVQVVKILALTVPFLFLISPQGAILMSDDKSLKALIVISIFNLGLNILLNLLFIPQYGLIASAWITVISDILGFTIFYFYIRRKFRDSA